ncbi:hypothetical protein Avbf_07954 [Armadillidium vulgare]|nr:hypothetical protein Avbf_07954 [Armadillidium vulgare]
MDTCNISTCLSIFRILDPTRIVLGKEFLIASGLECQIRFFVCLENGDACPIIFQASCSIVSAVASYVLCCETLDIPSVNRYQLT